MGMTKADEAAEKHCELCGTPVRIVGHTTKHYEPIAHARANPVGDGDHATCIEGLRAMGRDIAALRDALVKARMRFEGMICNCEPYRNGQTLEMIRQAIAPREGGR